MAASYRRLDGAPAGRLDEVIARRPDGFTLVETLVALALLGIALLLAAATVARATAVERRAAARAVALEHVASVAEELRATAYASVLSDTRDLSGESVLRDLPEPVLTLTVEEDEELGLKRVRIELGWEGRHAGTVRLDTAVSRLRLYR